MSRAKKYLGLVTVLALLATLTSSFLFQSAKAAGGNFHVFASGSSISVAKDSSVTIPVYINTGGSSVDAIDMTFTYDTSKLEFQSATASGSAFSQSPIYNNASGTISGGAFTTTPVNGDYLVFTATFRAKVGTGSSAVQVASGSAAYGGGNSIGATLGSGTINFTTPTCAAGQTGTYPNCVTPTSSGTGSTGGSGNNTTGNSESSNSANSNNSSNNGSPTNNSSNEDKTIALGTTLPKLVIGVYDKNHKPLRYKKVTLHSEPQTVVTDGNGNATFTDVPYGEHTLVYADGGKEYSQPVSVSQDLATTGTVSNATAVVLPFEQKTSSQTIIVAITSSMLVLAGAAAVLVLRRQPFRRHAHAVADSPGAMVMLPEPADETTSLLNAIPNHPSPHPGQTFAPRDPDSKE